MKKQKFISWFISFILILSMLLAFSACGNREAQGGAGSGAESEMTKNNAEELLAELEDKVFLDIVTGDSLGFHLFMKNPENFGLSSIEPTWGDYYTLEYYEKEKENNKWILEQLAKIDVNELNKEGDIILYKTLQQNAELAVKSYEKDDYYYLDDPFHVMNGDYINIPLVMAEFEFRKQADIDTYIALLKLYDEYIVRQIDYEKEKAERGFFMPDFVLDQVIEQCEGILNGSDDGTHYLFSTFNGRIDAIEWLDDEQKEGYKEENKQALTEYFFPAYDKIIEELDSLRGKGSEELSSIQKEYFLLLLQSHTSSNFEPEYIIGLLDEALNRSIYLQGMAFMANDDVYDAYLRGDLSKGGIEQDLDYIISIYDTVFPKLPEHNLDMQLLPESMRFINAAAYYIIQPVDDYVDNIIRINPSSAESDPAFMFVLAHEGYGGHLLQSVYDGSNGIGNLRPLLSPTCYQEGFANYGASCVLEVSDFDEALINFTIGDYAADAIMSARMEMGIFCEGWTAKEVLAMLQVLYGLSPDDERSIEIAQSYYEWLYASKGTMCRYGFGLAFFNKLRDTAEEELSDNFDLLEFNTRILDIGPCHLNTLEEMLGYIISQEEEGQKAA